MVDPGARRYRVEIMQTGMSEPEFLLANAFFYAGAQNLVVTHWAIPSNPAVGISVGMVEAQRDAAQPDWAKALQASILRMMDGDGPVAYVHPGAWRTHMVVGAEMQ